MKLLITGSSRGIGKAVAERFLKEGFDVYGFDMEPSSIEHPHYRHWIVDVRKKESFPELPPMEYLFLNAGTQNGEDDIATNLVGTMNVCERYAFREDIRSVLFNASASASTGFEFSAYCASKAGVVGYMKNVAWRLAKNYQATANALSLGGVLTESNASVIDDDQTFASIMEVTPLKKWMTLEEVADWVYFLLVINKSASGQEFVVDNGERDLNCTFVWDGFDGK